MAPKPLQQGDPDQIGHYRLTARLGSGGMGVVYLAHAADGRPVAVKVLRPEYADDAEFRARFQREVAAMGRVRNRYTVQVLDADTDSAMPFLATEFADGPSLDEHVKDQGPLRPETTTRLAAALAEALAAIHAAGVTHRDLKPSNVLLTGRGPMVIDFGIAQVADTVSITRTGMAIGSPGYMAPEQITGHAGREADIFTWALIVAFAASGRPPFGTGATVAILQRILNDRPDIAAVPPNLMPLVQAALAQDPKRRPAAADLVRELSPGSTATRTAVMSPRTVAMGPQTAVAGQATRDVRDNGFGGPDRTRAFGGEPGPRRRWFWPALGAAVVVAVLVGVGAALAASGGAPPGSGTARGGGTPTPSATGPALSGSNTGGGTGFGPAPGAGRGHGPGKRHRPPGQGGQQGVQQQAGDGTDQNGGGASPSAASTPAASASASPSASVAASPSGVPSASVTPGVPVTPSATPSATGG